MSFTIKRRHKEIVEKKKKPEPKGEEKGKRKTENPPPIVPAMPISNSNIKNSNSSRLVFQHKYKNELIETSCPAVLVESDVIIDQGSCESKTIGMIQTENEKPSVTKEQASKKAEPELDSEEDLDDDSSEGPN